MSPFRRPTGATLRREDVEGFLEGVAYRVQNFRGAGRPGLESELARARSAVDASDLANGESILLAIDRRLDGLEGERELAEFPRGLVDYVAVGDRGHPTPNEEDPLANRIRLVGRLLDLRRSQGRDVAGATRTIREAEAALGRGDRGAARSLCDAAHTAAESSGPGGSDPEG
ncbi:MAG TPA: hypothetical protein VIZ68_07530 [Thermoplasmata archaeon]